MTPDTLAQALDVPMARAELWCTPINRAMADYDILGPVRQAAFIAQVAHESGLLRFTREIWGPTPAQVRYEGRKDLGNTQTGDGFRFRGRGLIQLTGRSNYAQFSRVTGVDFVASPEKLEIPTWAAAVAGWFWQTRGLNDYADPETPQSFVALTQKINGGTNGLEDRKRLWALSRKAFGLEVV